MRTQRAQAIRSQFPVFANNPDLIYLDSASSTQKPQSVIDAVSSYIASDYANVHRGAYALSQRSESMVDAVRSRVAQWMHASPEEIIFTKNSTDATNLLVQSLVQSQMISD